MSDETNNAAGDAAKSLFQKGAEKMDALAGSAKDKLNEHVGSHIEQGKNMFTERFGHVRGNVGGAVKEGLQGMKFWGEGAKKGPAFGKIAATGVGIATTLHALKSKGSDGEPRSIVGRVAEGAVGIGLTAGGVLARA